MLISKEKIKGRLLFKQLSFSIHVFEKAEPFPGPPLLIAPNEHPNVALVKMRVIPKWS